MVEIGNERPKWCPHPDCQFKRHGDNVICGGILPEPADHGKCKKVNDKRICFKPFDDNAVIDYQVNDADLEWFRWIFDALDGKKTSWMSRIGEKNEERTRT